MRPLHTWLQSIQIGAPLTAGPLTLLPLLRAAAPLDAQLEPLRAGVKALPGQVGAAFAHGGAIARAAGQRPCTRGLTKRVSPHDLAPRAAPPSPRRVPTSG